MALYELNFVTRADMSKQDVEKEMDFFAKIITDNGGKTIKTEYWGLRPLAYKINKSSRGHYFFLGVDAGSDAINEVLRQTNIKENIVRYLNVKVDEISSEPTVMMQKERDDRPRSRPQASNY